MKRWSKGQTVVVRNVARSDGTVSSAVPAFCIQDSEHVLALFIPRDTPFKNNYVVSAEKRTEAVTSFLPSAKRAYQDLAWWHDTVRLYLPDKAYSVWLFFDEKGNFTSWYGNLEAPFIRTAIGIDTQDYGLDVVATSEGKWQWKDEAEFQKRLEVGVDSAEHQARVRAAGEDLVQRLENHRFPFSNDWKAWQAPEKWAVPTLPEAWSCRLWYA